jgi:hypothetical protein
MNASVFTVAWMRRLERFCFLQKHYIPGFKFDFKDAIEARLFELMEKVDQIVHKGPLYSLRGNARLLVVSVCIAASRG